MRHLQAVIKRLAVQDPANLSAQAGRRTEEVTEEVRLNVLNTEDLYDTAVNALRHSVRPGRDLREALTGQLDSVFDFFRPTEDDVDWDDLAESLAPEEESEEESEEASEY